MLPVRARNVGEVWACRSGLLRGLASAAAGVGAGASPAAGRWLAGSAGACRVPRVGFPVTYSPAVSGLPPSPGSGGGRPPRGACPQLRPPTCWGPRWSPCLRCCGRGLPGLAGRCGGLAAACCWGCCWTRQRPFCWAGCQCNLFAAAEDCPVIPSMRFGAFAFVGCCYGGTSAATLSGLVILQLLSARRPPAFIAISRGSARDCSCVFTGLEVSPALPIVLRLACCCNARQLKRTKRKN